MKFEHISILLGGPESLDRFTTLQADHLQGPRVMFVNSEEELTKVRELFSWATECNTEPSLVVAVPKKRGRKANPARSLQIVSVCGTVTVKVKPAKVSKSLE
jgi:hypothetical protein